MLVSSVVRELVFAVRLRSVRYALLVAFVGSCLAIVAGVMAVNDERSQIQTLEAADALDRTTAIANQSDPGGVAYYAFHLTYASPADLAFVARGTLDTLPWKHRIRMLALEGQLYEADIGNPELNLSGYLDYAFVIGVLLPLLFIFTLYDVQAGERRSNRHDLLMVTAVGEGSRLFAIRSSVLALSLWLAFLIPFAAVALWLGVSFAGTMQVAGLTLLSAVFWLLVCRYIVARVDSGPTCLAALLGVWLALAVLFPAASQVVVRSIIDVPSGGALLMAQREAVNDAWDLPKPMTMNPFIARHPEYAPYQSVQKPFEWKWYYAFQQVGDQTVEDMSAALRGGVARRDKVMGWLSIFSPPMFIERSMAGIAKTDVQAFHAYEDCVRAFHASLRGFYYPMLFGVEEFSEGTKDQLPEFEPCD